MTNSTEREPTGVGHQPPYRLLAEMASDVAMEISADSKVIWISPTIETVLGWGVDEILGTSIFDRMHPDDVARGQQARDRVMSGVVVRNDLRFLAKDGEYRWMSARLAPVHDEDGNVIGRVAGWHDVSAEYALREELQKEQAHLRQLAETLEASEREAKEANAAKTAFLSRMSHELRTPLNAVLGFAQLLQLDELAPAQQEATEQIVTGGRHLLDLINEVLDISRIESGRLTVSPEAVSVGEVIEESIDLVRGLADAAHVQIERFSSSQCAEVAFVDRQRMVQILLNLLSNAVKYNRPGGGVRVGCSQAEGGMLHIDVHDDGCGIAPELMGRLFQPFDRLGAETRQIEGTGIGLALSHGLAEMMHGRIDVRSTPGVGSVFTLVVPRAGMGTQDAGHTRPVQHDAASPTRPTVVMYVEDNPANALLMRSIVERLDHVELRVAASGEAALEWVTDDPPDLVMLDLHLPDIPGEEVLRRIRTNPRTAAVPVVVVSADAALDVQGRLSVFGVDGFLAKPVDISEILAWVRDPRQGRRLEG